LSSHGTNPASAQIAGLKVVTIKNDSNGNIDLVDLQEKCQIHKGIFFKKIEKLSCMMVTYPSTFGIFENGIKQAISMIHECGGQVYLDGANMNA
jgi:glycine dehydrogenase